MIHLKVALIPLRFDEETEHHFTTFNAFKKRHFLTFPLMPEMLIEHLKQLRRNSKLLIYGFVIMPNHVHLLWKIPASTGISMAVKSFKGNSGRHILSTLRENVEFDNRIITQANGKQVFWQRGFYDFNITTERNFSEKLEYIHNCQLGISGKTIRLAIRFISFVVRFTWNSVRSR